VVVDGYDSDVASIEQARMNAQEGGVADRVKFHIRDAGDPELSGQYDFVMALECVHDMAHPVAALETMRRLAKEGGAVLVVDERVSESFTGKAEGVEPLMYGFSVLHCLPVGMSDQPSAGTGTVMRPGTLRNYAAKAGYKSVEIVNIEHPMFRFYRLHC
jgi:2-polyprenyl-3-methyl-5-hydroxy-6-metoxy-1,4-benzoquinol methylase